MPTMKWMLVSLFFSPLVSINSLRPLSNKEQLLCQEINKALLSSFKAES